MCVRELLVRLDREGLRERSKCTCKRSIFSASDIPEDMCTHLGDRILCLVR